MRAAIHARIRSSSGGAARTPFLFHSNGGHLKSALMALVLAWGPTMAANDAKQEILFDSVEILSQTKARAESRVKLLRSLQDDGEVKAEDMRRLRLLYDEARADVNAGLDRILVELESTGSNASVDPYPRVAERASKRAAEFLAESDTVIFGGDRGAAAEAGAKLADSLVTAFVDVWKTLRGERSARNEKLAERIGSLKWQSFDQIE